MAGTLINGNIDDDLIKYSTRIVDQLRKFGSHLSFSITQRCPLECSHCITNSKPSNDKSMDLSDRLVDSICAQLSDVCKTVRQISLTGGEPFLRVDIMQRIAESASANSMHVGAVTSGYWAASTKSAKFYLNKIPDVSHITMSYDVYHKKYIKEEVLENFVRESTKFNKTATIRVSIKSKPNEAEHVLFEKLKQRYGKLVHKQEIVPFGRASNIVDNEREYREAPSLPCLSSGPHIYYNGNTVPCCSALKPTLNTDHPLNLGNANELSLAEIVSSANKNILLNIIRIWGFELIHDSIIKDNESGVNLLTRIDRDSQCTYCARLMHNNNFVKKIEDILLDRDNELQIAYHRFLFDGNDEALKIVISKLKSENRTIAA